MDLSGIAGFGFEVQELLTVLQKADMLPADSDIVVINKIIPNMPVQQIVVLDYITCDADAKPSMRHIALCGRSFNKKVIMVTSDEKSAGFATVNMRYYILHKSYVRHMDVRHLCLDLDSETRDSPHWGRYRWIM